jgi:hypothetical protein
MKLSSEDIASMVRRARSFSRGPKKSEDAARIGATRNEIAVSQGSRLQATAPTVTRVRSWRPGEIRRSSIRVKTHEVSSVSRLSESPTGRRAWNWSDRRCNRWKRSAARP